MTRENKLALVVGFGLILLVGILVSDHFSPARTDAAANLTDDPADAPSADHIQVLRTELLSGDAARAAQRRQPTFGQGDRSDGASGPAGRSIPERNRPAPPATDDPGTFRGGGSELRPPGDAGAESRPPRRDDAGGARPRSDETQPRGESGGGDDGDREALNIGLDPEDGRGQEHVVRPGETLAAICRLRYGDDRLWPLVAKYNRIADPSVIRENDVIQLPPRDRLDLGSAPRTPRTETAPRSTPRTAATPRTYVVKSTDVLSTIAQRELGTVKRMQEIIDLNRDQIDDPDDIKAGMRLTLPPK